MALVSTADSPILTVNGLTKSFATRKGLNTALDTLDLTINAGEFVVIVGPSGCGKTTLLRILAGLERPTTGDFRIRQDDHSRPLIGVVFQDQSVFPWLTVRRNVGYGLAVCGVDRSTREKIVDMWIARVGLSSFADAYPHQLSGGMKQRVSLARALALDSTILLMDEPFSALDELTKTTLQQELLRIWETLGKTVMFVTHSIDEAITLGDRILVMGANPGRLKEMITVPFSRPRNVMALRTDPRYGELVYRIWELLHNNADQASGGNEVQS